MAPALSPATAASEAPADRRALALEHLRRCDVPGYREAVVLLVEERERDPESSAVHAALAEAFAHWGWRREIVGLSCRGHYDEARASASRALELSPEAGDSHRAMAAALGFGPRRDPERRLAEARRAWEINPYHGANCLELWRARGRGADDAMAEQAVALDPSSCAAHIDLGVALTEAGRHEEAAYHLGRALELNPRNTLARYDLAMVRWRQDRPERAREELAEALRLDPGDALLRRGLETVRSEGRSGGPLP